MAPLSKTMSKTILPLSTTETAERRAGIRYQITVSAEVIELISGTRFSTRTTDLGPGGCFVDTLMPLPVGSSVRVRLHKDDVAIEALGTVTYSQTGLGMGVAFDNMPAEKARALDAWLAELTRVRPTEFESHQTQRKTHLPSGKPSDIALAQRLIRLLVKRGVISEADAAAILNEYHE
ncbi:MAG: PilZ domain-containing protein [Candidatus Acidiferrales bacterium]